MKFSLQQYFWFISLTQALLELFTRCHPNVVSKAWLRLKTDLMKPRPPHSLGLQMEIHFLNAQCLDIWTNPKTRLFKLSKPRPTQDGR